MKKVIITVLLLLLAACTAPAEDAVRAGFEDGSDVVYSDYDEAPINMESSFFEFEGYGPGKSHVGTFDELFGLVFVKDGKVIGGGGTIQASSVNTGIGGLDTHLKSVDFFDVDLYPEIKVVSTSLSGNTLGADLTFRGVTKQISFPVDVTSDGISADFVIDTAPFGMNYKGVNNEVRIAFEFKK